MLMGQPTERRAESDATATRNGRGHPLDQPAAGEEVELRVPASSRYLRLARLTVAGFAGDLAFDMHSIEDLRVAVDELCAVAIDGASPSDQLELRYSLKDGQVRVDGQVLGAGLEDPELHPVARELLNIVADGFDMCAIEGGRAFWIVKGAGNQS